MFARFFRRLSGACLVSAATLALTGPAFGETLVLTDGAVIHGDVTALDGDVYVVRTESLGTIRVHKKDVRTIEQGNAATSRPAPASTTRASPPPAQIDLEAMQSRMLQSPDMLAMIEALQDDPEIMAVLADPAVMAAMAAGDYAALMNHPKILALMHNANVQAVIDAAQ